VREFDKATKEVLDVAKIKTSVYNQTVMMYLITSADCFLQSAQLSMFSPFEVCDKHKQISESKITQIFDESSAKALEFLKQDKILAQVNNERVESDLLTYFDCLMQDYIFSQFGVESDQFRALLVHHYVYDLEEENIFEGVCADLYEICSHLKRSL
jgi:hypothetical protein